MNASIPLYISIVFILLTLSLLVLFMIGLKVALKNSGYPDIKKKKIFLAVPVMLTLWLSLLAILSSQGFFLDFESIPPKIFISLLPILVLILILVFSKALNELLLSINPTALVYLQVFRVLMEIILWLLFLKNIIPVQMTFEGYNFDIIAGLTAPLAAFIYFKNKNSWVLIGWNILCLGLLINIVTIAILSTPSFLRQFMNEPANTVVAYFPFIWLPGFVVPFAFFLHLCSIKQMILLKREIL